MRSLLPLLLVLSACSTETAPTPASKGGALEPFLAALGAPFTSCGRTVAPSVPAELADAWGRRYARAARIEE